MTKQLVIIMISLAMSVSFGGCGAKETTDKEAKAEDKAEPDKAASDQKDAKETEKEEKKPEVTSEQPKPVRPTMEKLSASHILLMHTESKRKPPTVTRTKEEAKKLADELSGKLKGGADFAELAKEHSDCPSGKAKGGDLGIFPGARMAPEFTEGVKALKDGEISEPVESPFGYHIIKRQKVEEVHARHILVMHDESRRKPASIKRTKEEARKLIEEIKKQLDEGGDFAKLAAEHSDCPSGKRKGGDLGQFGKGRMAPPFEEAAFSMKENELSGIVETDFGFHVIQRLP